MSTPTNDDPGLPLLTDAEFDRLNTLSEEQFAKLSDEVKARFVLTDEHRAPQRQQIHADSVKPDGRPYSKALAENRAKKKKAGQDK